MRRGPEERYASTQDLARELSTVRDHLSETVSKMASVAAGPRPRRGLWLWVALGIGPRCRLVAGRIGRSPVPSQPSFQRLTFRNGFLFAARFAPAGKTIVYTARWDGKPPQIFLTRAEAPGSQRLRLSSREAARSRHKQSSPSLLARRRSASAGGSPGGRSRRCRWRAEHLGNSRRGLGLRIGRRGKTMLVVSGDRLELGALGPDARFVSQRFRSRIRRRWGRPQRWNELFATRLGSGFSFLGPVR